LAPPSPQSSNKSKALALNNDTVSPYPFRDIPINTVHHSALDRFTFIPAPALYTTLYTLYHDRRFHRHRLIQQISE
jgi:hypothetical protein